MKIFFLFIFFSIIIILWFILYIYKLFDIFNNNNDLIYKDILNQIKKPDIFYRIKNGNNVSRIIINGFIDIKHLQNDVNEKQKLVDQINEQIKNQNLENEIDRIKKQSLILKKQNDELNNKLSELKREFDKIVNNTNNFTVLLEDIRYEKNIEKDLLHYLYDGMKDPFNIIF